MAAKNMPITARQAMAIVGFTGLTEELVRVNWRTSGEASTLIGLAADGNGEAVFMAVSEKGLAASPTIASLVEAYAAKKRAKAEEGPSTPAPSPATPRVVATEGAPAEANAIRDAIQRSLSMFNESFQQDILGKVDTLNAMVAELAAKQGTPTLPGVPEGGAPDYFRPRWFNELYSLVDAGFDVLIHGPAGCGKSRAGLEVGKVMQREGGVYAFRAGMRKADLLYSKELRDGSSVVELSPLMREVRTGVVTVIDEVFSVDPEVLIGMNGLLESGQRCIDTPLGVVNRDADHRFILTSNTDGRSESRIYRAPQTHDASTLSRVISVHVDYDEDVELQIAAASLAPDWQWLTEQAHKLRGAVRDNAIALDVSTRWIVQACQLNKRGFTKERSFGLTMLERLSDSERKRVGAAVCQHAACFKAA